MGILDRFIVREGRTRSSAELSDLDRRVALVPTSDLQMWVDNLLAQVGRDFQTYLRDGSTDALQEAKLAAETLSRLLIEAEQRRV